MKFNKIVVIDQTKLNEEALKELQELSEQEIGVYSDYPEKKEEIIKRIGDADTIIVSWHTQINEEIIDACPNLKYIGMACSLYDDESVNVAVNYAREKNIKVTGIFDYGDPGVAEFIISELIQLLNGYKGKQWKEDQHELTDLKIGIIGLGVTGKLLADCLLPFGADLYYFSRSPKKDYEAKGVKYLELGELLNTVEVVSFHLPKNVNLLTEKEFFQFGNGKILINTSLGLPFDEKAFQKWIKKDGNFAIFDADGKASLSKDILDNSNIITSDKSAGWSAQTQQRRSAKVVKNVKDYLMS
ncbi:dihydrofolate reductase [Christiangramia fulva]|uniref:Dihydrofolate reductase n=2 Tax=Christiangramia fulva TaxID=2126553 RepID=A0A2R3ZB14_9FLAO|nr:dihydrofolate reductase [Christiangramia fulva]